MKEKPKTVKEYLAGLEPDRRKAIEAVRQVIRQNLDQGYAEGIWYGMITYHVPHAIYPPGYHCDPSIPLPFVALASQKQYMSLYLFGLYPDPERDAKFREKWALTGRKLNMGKSCVRFKKLEDLALELIAEEVAAVPVAEHIARYEAATKGRVKGTSRAKGKR